MTEEELERWQDEFEAFHARFADLFERSESRKYLRGLLTEAERKNSWQVAEAVGDPIPDRMQRLLYRVPWDADAARDRLQEFVIETFGDPEGIGVVDETGFLKKGTHSVGVARQYTGQAREQPGGHPLKLGDQRRPRLPGPAALPAGSLGP
jgi:SRSO17 transposase